MNACFETIIVPVDFSRHTDAALKKAVALSSSSSTIHLLYVQPHSDSLPLFAGALLLSGMGFLKSCTEEAWNGLRGLQKKILDEKPEVQVRLSVVKDGLVKNAILHKARSEAADLIIIGKSDHRSWLSFLNPPLPVQLAKEAPCAVLTVAPNVSEPTIKTVLVPVIKNVTYNTMGVIAALSKKSALRVHLIMFTEDEHHAAETAPAALLRVYQWVKTTLRCQVQYKALPAHRKTAAMRQYAETVHADVIVVDPELQLKTSWWQKHNTSLLHPESNVSVLAVQPTGAFVAK